jgi:periplasmic copper chaperone A
MKRIGSSALHLVGIALVLLVVLASAARAADLRVEQGWIRALPLAVPSAGYFTIHNGSRTDVVLIGAESPACGHVSLHKSEVTGGICRMRDAAEVDVPALGELAFAAESYHLMCEKAKPVLKPGAAVPMTLIFKNGDRLTANFAVRNALGR